MLVGYSSSSEEENDAVTGAPDNVKSLTEEDAKDNCSARKKPKIEDNVPKTRCIICFVFNRFIDWGPGQRKRNIAKYKTTFNESKRGASCSLPSSPVHTNCVFFILPITKKEDVWCNIILNVNKIGPTRTNCCTFH